MSQNLWFFVYLSVCVLTLKTQNLRLKKGTRTFIQFRWQMKRTIVYNGGNIKNRYNHSFQNGGHKTTIKYLPTPKLWLFTLYLWYGSPVCCTFFGSY